MKHKTTVIQLVPLFFFAAFSANTYAKNGVYVGIGYGSASTDTGITAGTASLDEDDTGYKLIVGKQFDENIAIEGIYVDLGEASLKGDNGDTFSIGSTSYSFTVNNASITAEGSLIGVNGVFSHPISAQTSLYANLGLASWEVDATVSGSGLTSSSASSDGTDLFYGLGVDYQIYNDWSVRGSYEIFNFDDDDADMLSISAVKHF